MNDKIAARLRSYGIDRILEGAGDRVFLSGGALLECVRDNAVGEINAAAQYNLMSIDLFVCSDNNEIRLAALKSLIPNAFEYVEDDDSQEYRGKLYNQITVDPSKSKVTIHRNPYMINIFYCQKDIDRICDEFDLDCLRSFFSFRHGLFMSEVSYQCVTHSISHLGQMEGNPFYFSSGQV